MKIHPKQFAEKILKGDKASLSKAITWAESTKESHIRLAHEIIQLTSEHTNTSIRIGITGVPGAGKSTFIEALGEYLVTQGKKVAVLAIDPSSYISHGSILGDKTRMEKLSAQENAFVRPTASGLSLGGLHNNTYDSILLCEAAGYEIIFIETVGVGQNEVEVTHVCDFFLLLAIGGAGDELQGVKRGIMEMCHGIVVNKADGENLANAIKAQTQISKAIRFLPKHSNGWKVPVLKASSISKDGIDKVWKMIIEYVDITKNDGTFESNRLHQKIHIFQKQLQKWVWEDYFSKNKTTIQQYITMIQNNEISPNSALDTFIFGEKK